jgi:hypothetical protein
MIPKLIALISLAADLGIKLVEIYARIAEFRKKKAAKPTPQELDNTHP